MNQQHGAATSATPSGPFDHRPGEVAAHDCGWIPTSLTASAGESIRVPAGALEGVLKVRETTPLEPDANEDKYYARGIGLVVDDQLSLVGYGPAG